MLGLIMTIVLIYLCYYIWIVINFDKSGKVREKKLKKNSKSKKLIKNKDKKMPVEVQYFVLKYRVDLSKINYRYFLQLIGLVVSFDLSIVITIISYIDSFLIQMLVGFVLIIAMTLASFKALGVYFKKKGLTLNDDNKRNRK